MEVQFLRKFSKDLDKISQPKAKKSILEIVQLVQSSDTLDQIPGVRKLVGFDDAYRIRSGDYRIGVFHSEELVQFARVAHRKDIYKVFP